MDTNESTSDHTVRGTAMSDDLSFTERRRFLVLVGAGVTAGLSGCSGGDDAGTPTEMSTPTNTPTPTETPTNTPRSTDTPTPTDTQTSTPSPMATTTSTPATPDDGEPVGEVVDNAVEELEITDWSGRIDDDDFVVTLSIKNTGNQQTQLVKYWYDIRLYDAENTNIRLGKNTQSPSEETDPAPGEVGVLNAVISLENDNPEDVARYETSITCTLADDAVYCEE